MPKERPSAIELVEAVQEFIQSRALPALSGHLAFEARVAANLLAVARREIGIANVLRHCSYLIRMS